MKQIEYADAIAALDPYYLMMFAPMLDAFLDSIDVYYSLLQPLESFFNDHYEYAEGRYTVSTLFNDYSNTLRMIQYDEQQLTWLLP
ncbi:MAG: hypothetical protein MZU79_02565 [Anaerotruncus sp.]|nr:hypothetical protein [Anaerotruncus sp.]